MQFLRLFLIFTLFLTPAMQHGATLHPFKGLDIAGTHEPAIAQQYMDFLIDVAQARDQDGAISREHFEILVEQHNLSLNLAILIARNFMVE